MKKLLLGVMAVAAGAAQAKIELATPFSDGMVLQRARAVPVWGRAEPGRTVVVEFAGQTARATVAADGAWKAHLAPMEASKESRTLRVSEREAGWLWDDETDAVEVLDVLVGEVWMCAGQSNTDCPVWGENPRYRDGMGAMSLQTTVKPFVRLVKTPLIASTTPRHGYPVKWLKMTPQDLDFASGMRLPSAMGYYFALELANALDIPVGLVDSSWGGTNIDAWTPRSGYEGLAGLEDERNWKSVGEKEWKSSMRKGAITGWHQQPSALWNGMVAAYAPMACRGFIWYQGCHNTGEAARYCNKMHALYNGWSKEFANPGLELYFVQLAPWGDKRIAEIQMAQAKFAAEEKNAAMAVINDVGNLHDIHPNDKRTVAKRLAAHALKRDYGWTWVKDESPSFKSMKVEGDKVTLSFDGVESWYLYNPKLGDKSNGFELAGTNGVFKAAEIVNLEIKPHWQTRAPEFKGRIIGRELVIRAKGVPEPTCVRYLHSAPWFGSLYNEVCLPLGAFAAQK